MAEVKIKSKLAGYHPDDVEALFKKGEISEDDVLDYAAAEDYRLNGLYGMDPDNVEHALNRGYLTIQDVEDYADAQTSPIGFYTKDIALRSPLYGINSAIKNFVEVFTSVPAVDIHTGEQIYEGEPQSLVSVPMLVDKPKTGAGEVVSEISEFITGFIPSFKITKAAGLARAITNWAPIKAIASRFPRLGAGIVTAAEGAVAGAAPDFLNDPMEGGLADAMKSLGILPEFLEFMTTSPDNPHGIERFKRVLEGVVLGAAADGIFAAAQAYRAARYAKHAGDSTKVATEIREAFPDVTPANLRNGTDLNSPPSRYQRMDEAATQPAQPAPAQPAPAQAEPPQTAPAQVVPAKEATAQPAPQQTAHVQEAPTQAAPTQAATANKDVAELVVPEDYPQELLALSVTKGGTPVEFTSEVDKALYVVTGKVKSKHHDMLMRWLKRQGLADADIKRYGKDIRSYVNDQYGAGVISVPDMGVRRGAKAPVVEQVVEEAPTYTKEQINRMDPHLLTPEQYSSRLDAYRLPSAKELYEDETLLQFNAIPAAQLDELAVALKIPLLDEKGHKATRATLTEKIRARVVLADVLDKHPDGLFALPDAARRALYKELVGEMPRGKAATKARLTADVRNALEGLIRDNIPALIRARHAAYVMQAIRRGREVPPHVIREYRDLEWAQAYAKAKGISLADAAPTRERPSTAVEPEGPPKAVEPEGPPKEGPPRAAEPQSTPGGAEYELRIEGEPSIKRTAQDDIAAMRILKKTGDVRSIDDALARDDNFLARIEAGSANDTDDLIRRVFLESGELIEQLRKTGSGTFANISAQSRSIFNQLGELTGRSGKFAENFFGAALGFARAVHKEMEKKAAQAHFINQFFVTYADATAKLVDEALDELTGTFEKQVKAFMHIKQLQELQALVFGIRAEGGRLLNSYNMKFAKGKFDLKSVPKETLKELQEKKREDILEVLKSFQQQKTTKDKMLVARTLGKNPLLRGVLELVQANMLWSPVTHFRNVTGNAFNLAWKTITRTLGLGLQTITSGDVRYLQAAVQQWRGIGDGFVQALRFTDMNDVIRGKKNLSDSQVGTAWKSLWSGEGVLDQVVKDDIHEASIILESLKGTGWGKPLAHLLTGPFHALVGMDEFFKTMAYRSRLREEAFKLAMETGPGKSMKELTTRARVFAADPSPELHYRALAFAREVTFQEQLGKSAEKINQVLNGSSGGLMLKIAFMPFYKTPINILRQAAKTTPLGLLSREVREALMDRGSVRQKDYIIRMLGGAGLLFGFYQLYEQGYITGRCPAGSEEDWKNAKVPEYSIRLPGGKWLPYASFEPFGMVMGMLANVSLAFQHLDAYRTLDESTGERQITGEQLFSAAVLALTDATLNKTYMTSMREAVELITGAERMNPEKFLARQSEKFLTASSAVNFISEYQDKYVREVNEMADGIRKYYNRENLLPARHSLYGTPIPLDSRFLGLLKVSQESDDPVVWEFLNNGANVRPISKSIVVNGIKKDLTPQQLDEVEQIIEKLPVRQMLMEIIQSPGYQNMKDAGTKAAILKEVISSTRSLAKTMWLAGNKEVQDDIVRKMRSKAEAIMGYHTAEDPVARMNHWAKLREDVDAQPE